MFETLAKLFVYALGIYAGLGLIFAVLFVLIEVQRLDSEAQSSGGWFPVANSARSHRLLAYVPAPGASVPVRSRVTKFIGDQLSGSFTFPKKLLGCLCAKALPNFFWRSCLGW
jgi:hypothetical protein